MRLNSERLLTVALAGALGVVVGFAISRLAPVATAQAALPSQAPVTLAQDSKVALSDIGRLPSTDLIYIEFAAGGRCLASANGNGDIDCDW